MINILEKKTEKWWLEELPLLNPQAIRELIAKEVKQAYKAGMLNLNVLDNTIYQSSLKWTDLEGINGTIEMGNFKLLSDLYAQHKGL